MPKPPPTLMISNEISCCENQFCNSTAFTQRFSNDDKSVICDPMWKCIPISFKWALLLINSIAFGKSDSLSPNLFSSSPVVMYLCVCASTFGLILKAMGAVFPFSDAKRSMASISGSDSTLKQKISLSNPIFISLSVFPTPAKAIFDAGNPHSSALRISFPLTQSAPKP